MLMQITASQFVMTTHKLLSMAKTASQPYTRYVMPPSSVVQVSYS